MDDEIILIWHVLEALVVYVEHLVLVQFVLWILQSILCLIFAAVITVIIVLFLWFLVLDLIFLFFIFFRFAFLRFDLLPSQSLFILFAQFHCSHDLLLDEQVKIVVTFEATAQVVFRVLHFL